MSRSGYIEVEDPLDHGRYRAQVASAIRGKRGQRLLRDLLAALDAMPEKRLIAHELQDESGEVCALGACGRARGMDLTKIDPTEPCDVADAFDIADQLAREIAHVNDDDKTYVDGKFRDITPEERFVRVRKWVEGHLLPVKATP